MVWSRALALSRTKHEMLNHALISAMFPDYLLVELQASIRCLIPLSTK